MVSLGLFLVLQNRQMQMQTAATAGALFVESILTPLAHGYLADGYLSEEDASAVEDLFSRRPVAAHFEALKVWNPTGTLIFSSDNNLTEEEGESADLKLALEGRVVVEIYQQGDAQEGRHIELPYLEIHAPIHDLVNKEVVAVGEVYQDATEFLDHRRLVERTIWLAIAVSSLGISGVILMHGARRQAMERQIEAIRLIADQNRQLLETAEQTKLLASQSNEELLNRIGAEIHDGPIQLLSLMLLKAGPAVSDAGSPSLRELGNQVIAELRNISSDLILPEVEELSLADTLRLAVARSEMFTGHPVAVDIGTLPEQADGALKICCFRVVQEGLTNASHHASGHNVTVKATMEGADLVITVSDSGDAQSSTDPALTSRSRLGLLGLRNRLATFGGKVEFITRTTGGSDLIARFPDVAARLA